MCNEYTYYENTFSTQLSLAMVLLDRLSSAGSFNIITVVTIRINYIYLMTRVMTPESSEISRICDMDK